MASETTFDRLSEEEVAFCWRSLADQGQLCVKKLQEFFQLVLGEKLSTVQAKDLLTYMDANDDGRVGMEDFRNFMSVGRLADTDPKSFMWTPKAKYREEHGFHQDERLLPDPTRPPEHHTQHTLFDFGRFQMEMAETTIDERRASRRGALLELMAELAEERPARLLPHQHDHHHAHPHGHGHHPHHHPHSHPHQHHHHHAPPPSHPHAHSSHTHGQTHERRASHAVSHAYARRPSVLLHPEHLHNHGHSHGHGHTSHASHPSHASHAHSGLLHPDPHHPPQGTARHRPSPRVRRQSLLAHARGAPGGIWLEPDRSASPGHEREAQAQSSQETSKRPPKEPTDPKLLARIEAALESYEKSVWASLRAEEAEAKRQIFKRWSQEGEARELNATEFHRMLSTWQELARWALPGVLRPWDSLAVMEHFIGRDRGRRGSGVGLGARRASAPGLEAQTAATAAEVKITYRLWLDILAGRHQPEEHGL